MSNDLKQIQETLPNKHLETTMLIFKAKVCWMSHVFHNIPLKEISRNYSNRCLSLRNALVHVCDQTHPLTISISVKREHTHLPSTWHAHATTQHCVCVRESDSKGHFTNAACQGGGEQYSNSSITTIKHTSNQERESERCHRRRERRGGVERKERRLTKKENKQKGGEKKL